MNSHDGFILAAFGITGLIVAIMVIAIVMDHRGLLRALAKFPPRGGEGEGA